MFWVYRTTTSKFTDQYINGSFRSIVGDFDLVWATHPFIITLLSSVLLILLTNNSEYITVKYDSNEHKIQWRNEENEHNFV